MRLFVRARVQALKLDPAERKKADYQIPEDFDIRAWSRQEPWDCLVHEPREAVMYFRGSLARIAAQLLPSARLATGPDDARLARLTVGTSGPRAPGARLGPGNGAAPAGRRPRNGVGDPGRPLGAARPRGGATSKPVAQLRRMLLLIPAAWKVGPNGRSCWLPPRKWWTARNR